MRVLQVIDSEGLYGAEQVVLGLMSRLREVGTDCVLASIAEPGMDEKPIEAEARRKELAVRRHTMSAGPDRQSSRQLVEWAADHEFDLFHTHGYKANILIAGMRRIRRRLPAVATLHGWTADSLFCRIGVYEAAERCRLRNADRIAAVSEAMIRKWGLSSRYGDRLTMVHNGIPARNSVDSSTISLPADVATFINGRQSLFAAGRLSHEKGFDILLEALSQLRASGMDVCLVIFGEGDERERLENQIRSLGLENHACLPGYLQGASALVGHFDIVAIPSRTEGLPVVLLEALSAGARVVATAVGEVPEVMTQCGSRSCVPPGRPDLLSEELRDCLLQGHSKKVSSASAAVDRLFSCDAMTGKYLAIYRELAGSG